MPCRDYGWEQEQEENKRKHAEVRNWWIQHKADDAKAKADGSYDG